MGTKVFLRVKYTTFLAEDDIDKKKINGIISRVFSVLQQ